MSSTAWFIQKLVGTIPKGCRFAENGLHIHLFNKKNKTTLAAIFENPVRSDILWKDIESMLYALEAEISEGRGSRVRIVVNPECTSCIS